MYAPKEATRAEQNSSIYISLLQMHMTFNFEYILHNFWCYIVMNLKYFNC